MKVLVTKARLVIASLALAFVLTPAAQASPGGMMGGGELPSTALPPGLGNVRFDQKLGAQIPLGLPFRDESGKAVTLGQYFKPGHPVVLNLVYYDCPLLCTQALNGTASALQVLKLNIGKDYEVVTVSFDPREKPELAAAKKKAYVLRLNKPGAEQGWHFLTGDQASIQKLTETVGFHYQWDEAAQQYAHATGLMVATPDGRLSHYFYGVEYPPEDLRLGLVEASSGKIGNPVDAVLLYCFHYDPRTGKYGVVITNIIRITGLLTVLIIGIFLIVMFRGEHKRQRIIREPALGRSQHVSK